MFIPAYRFQIAGYRDVHEYRDFKQKEPVSTTKMLCACDYIECFAFDSCSSFVLVW